MGKFLGIERTRRVSRRVSEKYTTSLQVRVVKFATDMTRHDKRTFYGTLQAPTASSGIAVYCNNRVFPSVANTSSPILLLM